MELIFGKTFLILSNTIISFTKKNLFEEIHNCKNLIYYLKSEVY